MRKGIQDWCDSVHIHLMLVNRRTSVTKVTEIRQTELSVSLGRSSSVSFVDRAGHHVTLKNFGRFASS